VSPQPSRRKRHIVGKRQPLALPVPVAQVACATTDSTEMVRFSPSSFIVRPATDVRESSHS